MARAQQGQQGLAAALAPGLMQHQPAARADEEDDLAAMLQVSFLPALEQMQVAVVMRSPLDPSKIACSCQAVLCRDGCNG